MPQAIFLQTHRNNDLWCDSCQDPCSIVQQPSISSSKWSGLLKTRKFSDFLGSTRVQFTQKIRFLDVEIAQNAWKWYKTALGRFRIRPEQKNLSKTDFSYFWGFSPFFPPSGSLCPRDWHGGSILRFLTIFRKNTRGDPCSQKNRSKNRKNFFSR